MLHIFLNKIYFKNNLICQNKQLTNVDVGGHHLPVVPDNDALDRLRPPQQPPPPVTSLCDVTVQSRQPPLASRHFPLHFLLRVLQEGVSLLQRLVLVRGGGALLRCWGLGGVGVSVQAASFHQHFVVCVFLKFGLLNLKAVFFFSTIVCHQFVLKKLVQQLFVVILCLQTFHRLNSSFFTSFFINYIFFIITRTKRARVFIESIHSCRTLNFF